MRILLTGASGFLGKELYKSLKECGHQVIGVSRHGPDISCDITDSYLDIPLGSRPQMLIHSAAKLSFSCTDESIYRVNSQGTANILKVAFVNRIEKVVLISTAYLCGSCPTEGREWKEENFEERQSFRNLYEESKFHAEKLVREMDKSFSKTIFRPSIIVGNSHNGEASQFDGFYRPVKAMARMMQLAEKTIKLPPRERSEETLHLPELHLPISINGDPDSTLNLVPIDWVVEKIINNMEKEGTFHLTNPNPMKNREIIESTNKALGINGPHFVNNYQGRGPQDVLYNRMIRDFLPYLPHLPRYAIILEVLSTFQV